MTDQHELEQSTNERLNELLAPLRLTGALERATEVAKRDRSSRELRAKLLVLECCYQVLQQLNGDHVEAARLFEMVAKLMGQKAPRPMRGKANSGRDARLADAYRSAPLGRRENAVAEAARARTSRGISSAMTAARREVKRQDREMAAFRKAAEGFNAARQEGLPEADAVAAAVTILHKERL